VDGPGFQSRIWNQRSGPLAIPIISATTLTPVLWDVVVLPGYRQGNHDNRDYDSRDLQKQVGVVFPKQGCSGMKESIGRDRTLSRTTPDHVEAASGTNPVPNHAMRLSESPRPMQECRKGLCFAHTTLLRLVILIVMSRLHEVRSWRQARR